MGFEKTYLWEDPIHTGLVFGSVVITLISICYYSLISVVAYASLTALVSVLSLKIYNYVMVTFLKKEVSACCNIAKMSEDINVSIPEDKVNSLANNATTKLNAALLELKRLFLVENMLDSVKFGLSLWVLTYIGSWFNAMTLIIMSWVGLFTIPKVYINNKTQIDPVLDKIKAQLNEISGKVTAMIPQAKPADVKKTE